MKKISVTVRLDFEVPDIQPIEPLYLDLDGAVLMAYEKPAPDAELLGYETESIKEAEDLSSDAEMPAAKVDSSTAEGAS